MLQKITGNKLYEQVVEQIKNMIGEGIYKKGDMLPSEKDLMSITSVSRITIREALKILSEVGIIETRKGKGSFVIVDGIELGSEGVIAENKIKYRQSFEYSNQLRLMIEPEFAKQAAINATDEDVIKLEKCLNNGKSNKNNSESSFDEFHFEIIRIIRNPILQNLFQELLDLENENMPSIALIPPEKQKLISSKLDKQHYKIFEAIKNKNGDFAYFYMKEHMVYLLEVYKDYFDCFFV